jgi:hypothetical protein
MTSVTSIGIIVGPPLDPLVIQSNFDNSNRHLPLKIVRDIKNSRYRTEIKKTEKLNEFILINDIHTIGTL